MGVEIRKQQLLLPYLQCMEGEKCIIITSSFESLLGIAFDFSHYADKTIKHCNIHAGFPGGSMVKNLPAMQETRVQSLGWEDPLEKKMATHSSILAWEIPWTEEPGGLQPKGSQRD